jgi:hypothetical protein
LSTTQLLNTLLIVMFAVETNADSHTNIILNTVSSLIIRFFVFSLASISSSLDHETATTGWDKPLENGGEFLGDLLEGSFDSLVFTLIQDLNELLNGRLRIIELLSALCQGISLTSEGIVLLESFLVDMLVLLKSLVDLLQARLELG